MQAVEFLDIISDLKRLTIYGEQPKCTCDASEHFKTLLHGAEIMHSVYYSQLGKLDSVVEMNDEIEENLKLSKFELSKLNFQTTKLIDENEKLKRNIQSYIDIVLEKENIIKSLTLQLEQADAEGGKSAGAASPTTFEINTLNSQKIEPKFLEFSKEEEITFYEILNSPDLIAHEPKQEEIYKNVNLNNTEVSTIDESSIASCSIDKTLGDNKCNGKSIASVPNCIKSDAIQNIDDEAFQSCDELENKVNSVSQDSNIVSKAHEKQIDVDFESTSPMDDPMKLESNPTRTKNQKKRERKKRRKDKYCTTLENRSRRKMTQIIDYFSTTGQNSAQCGTDETSVTLDSFLQESFESEKIKSSKKKDTPTI